MEPCVVLRRLYDWRFHSEEGAQNKIWTMSDLSIALSLSEGDKNVLRSTDLAAKVTISSMDLDAPVLKPGSEVNPSFEEIGPFLRYSAFVKHRIFFKVMRDRINEKSEV